MLPEMLLWVCSLSQGHPSGERSASMVAHKLVEGRVLGRLHLGYQLSVTVLLPSIAVFRSIISAPAFMHPSDVFEQRLSALFRVVSRSSSSAFPFLFRSFPKKLRAAAFGPFVIKSPFRTF